MVSVFVTTWEKTRRGINTKIPPVILLAGNLSHWIPAPVLYRTYGFLLYPAQFQIRGGHVRCSALRAGSPLRDRDVFRGGSPGDTINTSHRLHWDAADPAVARRPAGLVGFMALHIHILGLAVASNSCKSFRRAVGHGNPSHDFTY